MLTKYSGVLAILALIYLSGVQGDVSSKTKNFIYVGDTLFYIEENVWKNWFQARLFCENLGYNLISLDSQEKYNVINRFLDDKGSNGSFWTSGNDFLTLGKHTWFPSGQPVDPALWHPAQPDNTNGEQHCDEFRYNFTYLMNDDSCHFQKNFICERSLASPPANP
ncbi:C-type lectin 37Da-like [Drosophila kikkawai]|uniref:C-type lectin 37Da-like n=1 Tax=Drosophila kikkawai TaxID=30033 RepID=A0ABM4GE99_DROKI